MTHRDRRALVVGAVAVAVAMLVLRVGPLAWRTWSDSRDQLQGRGEQLAWMQAQIARAPILEDSGVTVRRATAGLAPVLLSGGDAAEASASLTARVSQAAERAHVGIIRTEALSDSTTAGVARRVSLAASLESDTRGLLTFLGLLAKGQALTVVNDARMSAEVPAGSAAPEHLHTEITVTGWYLPSGSAR